ncbi:hypothetical protein BG621_03450 [Parasaccharibacter apium]|nr:hypothetical protein BG621_03450 [Parasaccharibacter apium]
MCSFHGGASVNLSDKISYSRFCKKLFVAWSNVMAYVCFKKMVCVFNNGIHDLLVWVCSF